MAKAWPFFFPEVLVAGVLLTFDEEGIGTVALPPPLQGKTSVMKRLGQSAAGEPLHVDFRLETWESGRLTDEGWLRAYLQEPGWLLANWAMSRSPLKGRYIFARYPRIGGGWALALPSLTGRWRPTFTEAWLCKVPRSARASFVMRFKPDGRGEGVCKDVHYTFVRPAPHVGSELDSRGQALQDLAVGSQTLLMTTRVVLAERLELQAEQPVEFYAEAPGLLLMKTLPGLPEGRDEVAFFVREGEEEEEEDSLMQHPLPREDWATLALSTDARVVEELLASKGERLATAAPTGAPGAYLDVCRVNGTHTDGWWQAALFEADRSLARGSPASRAWAALLLCTVASCAGGPLAAAGVDALAACLRDSSAMVRRTALCLLERLAGREPADAEPAGASCSIRVPHPPAAEGGAAAAAAAAAAREALQLAGERELPASGEGAERGGGGFRVLFYSYGSRGDVQPLLVLAKHLQARGCVVKALVRAGSSDLCKCHGIDAVPIGGDLQEIFTSMGGVCNSSLGELAAADHRWRKTNWRVRLREPFQAMQEFKPDAVLWTAGGREEEAFRYEDAHGVPAIPLVGFGLQPLLKTHLRQGYLREPPRPGFMTTSRLLEEDVPLDGLSCLLQTGFWAPEEDPSAEELAKEPLASLVDFLAAGPPPVVVGWGSLLPKGASPAVLLVRALAAARDAGERLVVLGGWAGLDALAQSLVTGEMIRWTRAREWEVPPGEEYADARLELQGQARRKGLSDFARTRCCFAASAPHRWLFPQCCCVVHHGGAGTAHASLAAGKPCVVTPIAFDQFHWAGVVERLGVGRHLGGSEGLPKVNVEELTAAIREALLLAPAAEALGAKLRAEPGAAAAADTLYEFLRQEVRPGGWHRRWQAIRGVEKPTECVVS